MTDRPPTPRPDRRPPLRLWLRVLLFASLAVNLLIAGMAISFFLFHDGPRGRPPRVDQVGGPLTHALSHEDRRAIGRALWREYRDDRPARSAIRAEYRDIIAALRAQPYDPAPVAESLGRQLAHVTERQKLGHDLLLQRLERMTPAEREAFADRLEEGLERMGRDLRDREAPRFGDRD